MTRMGVAVQMLRGGDVEQVAAERSAATAEQLAKQAMIDHD